MEKVIAVDLYNQVITGGVCMTLRQKAADSDHIPCVLIEKDTPPRSVWNQRRYSGYA